MRVISSKTDKLRNYLLDFGSNFFYIKFFILINYDIISHIRIVRV